MDSDIEKPEDQSGFEFSNVDAVIDELTEEEKSEDQVNNESDKSLEGEYQSSENAGQSARAIVSVMSGGFSVFGGKPYEESEYDEAERRLSPAIIRLNFRVPFFEYIDAGMYIVGRMLKSLKEIKYKDAEKGEDAKQEHAAAE